MNRIKEENIIEEATVGYYRILKKLEKVYLPDYINARFGDVLIQDDIIIGKKEQIIDYINLQIDTADELFEEEAENKKIYIENWKRAFENIKNEPNFSLLMLKKEGEYFKKTFSKELLKEINKIMPDLTEYMDTNEEYRDRCLAGPLGNLGLKIYDELANICSYTSFSTTDLMLAIEYKDTNSIREFIAEIEDYVDELVDDKEAISEKEHGDIIWKANYFQKELQKYEKENEESEEETI